MDEARRSLDEVVHRPPPDFAVRGIRAGALLLIAVTSCHPVRSEGLVIRAGVWTDGTVVVRDATVVVRGGRVEVLPRDAVVGGEEIDARDCTVLPGLIDGHVHFCLSGGHAVTAAEWTSPATKLRGARLCGVTTVASLGDDPDVVRGLRGVVSSGRIRTGSKGHPTECIGFERAVFIADTECPAPEGDFVKVVSDGSLSRERIATIIASAHAAKKPCFVHVATKRQALDALEAGADGIEHFPEGMDDEVLDALVARRAYWTPTLAAAMPEALREDAVPRAVWLSGAHSTAPRALDFSWILKAQAFGVNLTAGSDAGAPGAFFGPGLLRELELFVRAGLTPVEAIATATRRAERRLRLAPRADLIIVRGDVTQDIQALRSTKAVIIDGRVVLDRPFWNEPPERTWVLLGDGEATFDGAWHVKGRGWTQLVIDVPSKDGVVVCGRGKATVDGREVTLTAEGVRLAGTGSFHFTVPGELEITSITSW